MPASKFDIITVGGAVRDITFYTDEGELIRNRKDPTKQSLLAFEYGAKIRLKKVHFSFGGGATNAGVCFSRLGLKTASIIKIADDDHGKAIAENLKKQGVDTRFIQYCKKYPSGFSFILEDENTKEHIVFSFRGANETLSLAPKDLAGKRTAWIYSSSISKDNWGPVADAILAKVKKDKVKWAWNPGNKQLSAGKKGLKKYLEHLEVLSLNKDECIELAMSDPQYKKKGAKFLNNVDNLLHILYDWGPKNVLLTDGRNGAYVYNGKAIFYSGGNLSKPKDTTGAGDSFSSSFVGGLFIFKGDIERALRLAKMNASSVVSKVGAQNGLLTIKELKKKIK